MAVTRCKMCDQHIEWLYTRTGRRAPFNHQLVPPAELGDQTGWLISRVTVRGQTRAVVQPMQHCNAGKREAVRWVLVRHDCRPVAAEAATPAARCG